MRTKKYRAWDKVTETYLYSDTFPAMWLFFKELANRGIRHWETEDYTGLEDIEGTEIYEGDLLTYPKHGGYYLILWKCNDSDCGFDCERTKPSYNYMLPGVWRKMRVIGNICSGLLPNYENPELIK